MFQLIDQGLQGEQALQLVFRFIIDEAMYQPIVSFQCFGVELVLDDGVFENRSRQSSYELFFFRPLAHVCLKADR